MKKQFKKQSLVYSGFIILSLLLFQNCSPGKLSTVTQNSLKDTTKEVKVSEVGFVTEQDVFKRESVLPTRNVQRSPSSVADPVTESFATVPIEEKSNKIGLSIQGASFVSAGIVLSENEQVILNSFFPHDPRSSNRGIMEELILDAEVHFVGRSVSVCLSKTASDCASKGNFKSYRFQLAGHGTYAAVTLESFWQSTCTMKEFGDYHVSVQIDGEATRTAIIQHRAHLEFSNQGMAPSGVGFYSSTIGLNHYGFICTVPPANQLGWIKYPYGSLANANVRNNPYLRNDCYYRVLSQDEALSENLKSRN